MWEHNHVYTAAFLLPSLWLTLGIFREAVWAEALHRVSYSQVNRFSEVQASLLLWCIIGFILPHCLVHREVIPPERGLAGPQHFCHWFWNPGPPYLYRFQFILSEIPRQTVHRPSLAYAAYKRYLWWDTGALKALKFLQLHLFTQFLINLPRIYKTSRTRASLAINCASSICKGNHKKYRFLSPQLVTCTTRTVQHPAWISHPSAENSWSSW